MQSVKQQLPPLINTMSLFSIIRMFSYSYLNNPPWIHYHISSWSVQNWEANKDNRFCFSQLCDPQPSQSHWKCHQMVEFNGAYKYAWYENNWLESLHVMANISFCHTRWTHSQTNGWTNKTDYTDPDAASYESKIMSSFSFLSQCDLTADGVQSWFNWNKTVHLRGHWLNNHVKSESHSQTVEHIPVPDKLTLPHKSIC